MQFAIGRIQTSIRFDGTYPMQAVIKVDGKNITYNIANYQEWQELIDGNSHGLFRFVPEDQFAYFIPMSEVNVMLTQAYEQARLARVWKEISEAQNVVDASA